MTNKNSVIQAEGFFPSEKKWLFYRLFLNQHNKKGEILGIHGAFEHSGRYQELGIELAKRGYNFYILDLTGHGRSEGRRGYIHKFEDYLADIANFYIFLKKYKKMETPFLFGHNMGGLIAIILAAWKKLPINGLVLTSPLLKFKAELSFLNRLTTKFLSVICPGVTLSNNYIDPYALTHDLNIIEEYKIDPFILNRINIRWLEQISGTIKKVPLAAPYIDIPSLIFHGDKDPLIDPAATKKFFYDLGTEEKVFYIVRGAYHEVFNELGREVFIDKFVEWIDDKNVRNNTH